MEGKACCVSGHRDIPESEIEYVKRELRREIAKAVQDGYTRFFSGFAEGADLYFAEAVAELCREDGRLRLEAAIPNRSRYLALQKDGHTKALLDSCSEVHVISEKYAPNIYTKRNRFMVEASERVIVVYDGREKGGTVDVIRYAHRLKKELREIPLGRINIPNKA